MSQPTSTPQGDAVKRPRRQRASTSLLSYGEPMVWLNGGALALSILMIVGLLGLVVWFGLGTFWPKPIYEVRLDTVDMNGEPEVYMGQFTAWESVTVGPDQLAGTSPDRALEILAYVLDIPEDDERFSSLDAEARQRVQDAVVAEARRRKGFPGGVGNIRNLPPGDEVLASEVGEAIGAGSSYKRVQSLRIQNSWEQFVSAVAAMDSTAGAKLGDIEEERQAALMRAILLVATKTTINRGIDQVEGLLDQEKALALELMAGVGRTYTRKLMRRGNKTPDLYNVLGQWKWIDVFDIEEEKIAEGAILLETTENSRLVGYLDGFLIDGEDSATDVEGILAGLAEHHGASRHRWWEIYELDKESIGKVNRERNDARRKVRLAQSKLPREGRIKAEKLWTRSEKVRSDLDTIIGSIGVACRDVTKADHSIDTRSFMHDLSYAVAAMFARGASLDIAAFTDKAEAWRSASETGGAVDQIQAQLARFSEVIPLVTSMMEESALVNESFLERLQAFHVIYWESTDELDIINREKAHLEEENERFRLRFRTVENLTKEEELGEIVRLVRPNDLGIGGKFGVYLSRWKEFLFNDPREANSEGGVFPAIIGTVIMTLAMTIFVVPFGVLAALYIREYAKAGVVISVIRIAINNLAGVPSIVFGVFGLGFFCYTVGAGVDELFYPEYVADNTPKFGTGGVFWSALTLALLTLPVVIVATEESLAAVPKSMREGSYGCGASKWQTIQRIVLPRAMPGIMTGMILAMARGAGEVAPLMLVGAVKLAPELPLSMGAPPFVGGVADWSGSLGPLPTGPVHLERSFMHLGFHIYDVGFQSQDSEASKPMVYTTTLLLIGIVAFLNVAAIAIRTRLRRRFAGGQF